MEEHIPIIERFLRWLGYERIKPPEPPCYLIICANGKTMLQARTFTLEKYAVLSRDPVFMRFEEPVTISIQVRN